MKKSLILKTEWRSKMINEWEHCPLDNLIGLTVRKLEISSNAEALVFSHDAGRCAYETYAPCCSETWIAEMIGVDNLIGQTVLKVEAIEVEHRDDGKGRQQEDEFYGIRLSTTRGYVELIYRNSSNGCYAGSMGQLALERLDSYTDFKIITEDFFG